MAPADLLVVLHARRGEEVLREWQATDPDLPVLVALTGTDVYRDLGSDPSVLENLENATAIVALQEDAKERLPAALRSRTHVIYQSATPTGVTENSTVEELSSLESVDLAVVANLRPEKDPLLPARAIERLSDVALTLTLVGAELDSDLAREAEAIAAREPRFRWLGLLDADETRRRIAAAHLVVIPSRIEGSCNVLSEALVDGVPVLATRIGGLVGTLGEDYPGYFPVGDVDALARTIARAIEDGAYYRKIRAAARACAVKASPATELAAWRVLLATLLDAENRPK